MNWPPSEERFFVTNLWPLTKTEKLKGCCTQPMTALQIRCMWSPCQIFIHSFIHSFQETLSPYYVFTYVTLFSLDNTLKQVLLPSFSPSVVEKIRTLVTCPKGQTQRLSLACA